ncbi:MAG: D-alanine--D-alanine ligase [Gammaproteobacteria bacterium]|nr:D-alanine--D-alanine ligase [Gammaproteobacteria bacterium]MDH5304681.1 D-alanine--D-alanine ligase [Gammaproteobacteria bacterium]MDH5323180.1 D-alanine--D-alanine ligase [Gammaproteobacteria bacterium]
MRSKRVLLITHEDLVPPESIEGLSEKEIHEIRTEYDVYSSLYNLGHKVRILGISDRSLQLRNTIRDWKPHVVFNLLEEFGGIAAYDQHVVAYLEMIRQRYTGCNPRGLMLSRDKVLTKQVLAWHRIATPAFRLFPLGRRFAEPRKLKFPLFVKSATEDASLGISQASIVEDMGSLRDRVSFIHEQVQSDALVEEYIDGRELYIGVLGNSRLMTLPIWELNFGTLSKVQSGIATRKLKMDANYQKKHGISTGPAPGLGDSEADRLHRLAKRIYRALHLSGYARLDFRMRSDGSVFLLEANANPEITRGEDFAESAKAIGIDYETLISRIVNLGLAYMPEWRMYE